MSFLLGTSLRVPERPQPSQTVNGAEAPAARQWRNSAGWIRHRPRLIRPSEMRAESAGMTELEGRPITSHAAGLRNRWVLDGWAACDPRSAAAQVGDCCTL